MEPIVQLYFIVIVIASNLTFVILHAGYWLIGYRVLSLSLFVCLLNIVHAAMFINYLKLYLDVATLDSLLFISKWLLYTTTISLLMVHRNYKIPFYNS